MFDLPHIASRLYGTPLLVAPSKLDAILAAIGPRLTGEAPAPRAADSGVEKRPRPSAAVLSLRETKRGTVATTDGIAVIPVVGTMVRRGSWLDAASGMQSYAATERELVEALADPDVRGVMLEVDTPGGEAGGVFDFSNAIRRLSAEAGKPVWAIADEAALSAGYAIASAADQVWVTRTGEVGSIGVVAVHVDQSAADKQRGLAYTYIYAGKHKVDGNSHAPLPAGVRADFQKDIDAIYGLFVEQVASARGLVPDAVRGTEARIFRGADGVAAGLADNVGTIADAVSALAASLDRPAGSIGSRGSRTRTTSEKKGPAMTAPVTSDNPDPAVTDDPAIDAPSNPSPAPAPEAKAPAPAPAASGPDAAAAATAAREHAARVMEVADLARKLGVDIDAPKAIREGTSIEALQASALSALAAKSEAAPTLSANPVPAKPRASGWDAAFSKTRR